MKRVKYFLGVAVMATCCVSFWACSSDELSELEPTIPETPEKVTHTIPMTLEGSVVGYDESSSSASIRTTILRTAARAWADGDKIYMTFKNGETIIPGFATYGTASGWQISYEGDLPTGTDMTCEARFFVNPSFASQFNVLLDSHSEIYEDVNAKYTYSGGTLTVQAKLTPKTGRIRFTGTADKKINLTGITTFTTFSPSNNSFNTTKSPLQETVNSSGTTSFIYGYFAEDDRRIGIVGDEDAYTRLCSEDIFKTGESGYMAIPTETKHNNWRTGLYVKAAGVEFKMIPVVGHTSGFFFIGETEVTDDLYRNVQNIESSSQPQLPYSYISPSTTITWINRLNVLTSLNFTLPTKSQWLYAAKGGNKSQGFTYSGSNSADDVAWYSDNSGGKIHPVKQKAPNELGIYDMNGNVKEWTLDKSSTNNNYHYYLGGSYNDVPSTFYNENYTYSSVNVEIGFRLLLTF